MKTKRLWLHFICHDHRHNWVWKPKLLKSKLIYNSGEKMWEAPQLEFSWLCIVIQWTFYSKKQEYKSGYYENESVEEILQDRISTLEKAIYLHKSRSCKASVKDIELWKLIE